MKSDIITHNPEYSHDLVISEFSHHTVELLLLPEQFKKKQAAICCCTTYTHIKEREPGRQREGACVS